MASFTIEEVTDLDAAWPDLVSLFKELEEYHEPWLDRQPRQDWEDRWRVYLASSAERLLLLARESGDAIAYLNVSVRRDYGLFDEVYGFIEDAYIKADFRSRGLGQRLLRRAEQWCREQGAEEVRLNVVAGNKRGVRFWTLSGFQLRSMTMKKTLR